MKENPVLRKILQPNNKTSILDVFASNQGSDDNLIDRYFDFYASGNIREGEVISDSLSMESVQFGEDEVLNLVSTSKHI